MIDGADQRLQEWIGKVAEPGKVWLASPDEMDGKEGVSLHLMEVEGNPPPRGVHRPPLAIRLRYLVTTWFADPKTAHRLLGDIMFASMEEKEFEVESEPVPLAAWQAFGLAPRPSLVLRVPLNKPRPEKTAPRVRGRVSVRFGAMRPLHGQVLGPGGVPIMAASVTLPIAKMTARTDFNGRFQFPAVPKIPPVTEVHVNARGRNVVLPISAQADGEPLLIELSEEQI